MTGEYRRVTHEEFRAFLSGYPSKLEHNCTTICEPPMHGYYDWSKAVSKIGTADAAQEAKQAYCFYADGIIGDEFYVRICAPTT